MPNLVDMLVGKLALRRDMVSPASLRDALAEQRTQPASTLGQIMVRRRLLASEDLVELMRSAERAELACPRCQGAFSPGSLDPAGGLACPVCGATLKILFDGTEISDRLTTGRTGRVRHNGNGIHQQQAGLTGTGRHGQGPGQGHFADAAGSNALAVGPGGPSTRRDDSGSSRHRSVGPSGSFRFSGGGDFSGMFGPYEIVEELGRGGMGVVYKARQPHLDRFVALKILLAGELASNKQIKRFQREAEIAARLKHPSIVQIHDVGQVGDYHYFTMDFIDGAPLNKLIKKRQLGIRRAVEVVRDVARGLDHAHQRGAIHRDIKPANILVDSEGRGVITDFGLARDMDPNALSRLTRSGAAVGTPYYMSPEQAQGKRHQITGATDIYSLGVVLFEALTFELPFSGETQLELTTKILHDDPPRPTAIEPAIDRDVETIVLRTLGKDPRDRFATAGELADDLDRYLRGEPIKARRQGALERLSRAARRNWRQIGVAALALTVVALGTYVVVRDTLDPPPVIEQAPASSSPRPARPSRSTRTPCGPWRPTRPPCGPWRRPASPPRGATTAPSSRPLCSSSTGRSTSTPTTSTWSCAGPGPTSVSTGSRTCRSTCAG